MNRKKIYCLAMVLALCFLKESRAQTAQRVNTRNKPDTASIVPIKNLPKAKLIARNDKFDVYQLPIDNMPCLVPNKNFQSKMSTMKDRLQRSDSNMPNLFKKREVIPKE